jgi:hypothetical protein
MSQKVPSPLLGYNNNVRHRGRVFHIQTEDSGVRYGHIITHLFMDGGRILKSVKTSYAEYLGSERMGDIIREMMKQQHKAMFIALRDGKFDLIADGGAEPSMMTRALSSESPPRAGEPTATPTAPGPAPMSLSPSPPPVPGSPNTKSTPPEAEAPATVRQPPPEELSLDIDALERAAAAANAVSPVLRNASDLPPPPANLFRERTASGKYRITPPPDPTTRGPANGQPQQRMPGPVPARRASQTALAAVGERRYAPTRPASIFGQARPQQGKTIFGEDLISDKSLDEVILSYLAEDLDTEKK